VTLRRPTPDQIAALMRDAETRGLPCADCGHRNDEHTEWWDDDKFSRGGMGCSVCTCDDFERGSS
jgi:hypothetical protein